MKIAIRYYTRSGNTERLARAIGEAIEVEAKSIDFALEEKVDLLFLGCSYYAFDVDKSVKDFVVANKDKIGKIVCVGTSCMMKSMQRPMKKVTRACGVELSKRDFHCRGQLGKFFVGQPNSEDLAAAVKFAKEVIEE